MLLSKCKQGAHVQPEIQNKYGHLELFSLIVLPNFFYFSFLFRTTCSLEEEEQITIPAVSPKLTLTV